MTLGRKEISLPMGAQNGAEVKIKTKRSWKKKGVSDDN